MAIKCIPGLATHVDTIEQIEGIILSWKLATADAKQLRWTFNNLSDFKILDELKADIVNGTPREWVLDLMEAQSRLTHRSLLRDWEIPVFPVSGQDLIDAGMKPGPLLGKALQLMRQDWVASGYTETKEALMDYVDMYMIYTK
jgi:tRNA nucleotidyltransferase (CCA-adding enzyme)